MELARDGARVEDDQLSPAAAIVAAYEEQGDIYEHGLQPGDLKNRMSGRKRRRPRKGHRWSRLTGPWWNLAGAIARGTATAPYRPGRRVGTGREWMALTVKLTQEDYAPLKQLADQAQRRDPKIGISTVARELIRVGLGLEPTSR